MQISCTQSLGLPGSDKNQTATQPLGPIPPRSKQPSALPAAGAAAPTAPAGAEATNHFTDSSILSSGHLSSSAGSTSGKPRCTVKQRKPNQPPQEAPRLNKLDDLVDKVKQLQIILAQEDAVNQQKRRAMLSSMEEAKQPTLAKDIPVLAGSSNSNPGEGATQVDVLVREADRQMG